MKVSVKFCSLLWCFVLVNSAHGLSIFGSQFPSYKVESGNPALNRVLAEEIERQRDKNETLKQYKNIAKIARIEGQLLTERLKAEGYYDSVLRTQLKEESIIYRVFSGQQYMVKTIEINGPGAKKIPKSSLPIQEGAPLKAQKVLDGKSTIEKWVLKELCLFQVKVDYRVKIDSTTHLASVTFSIKESPSVQFGEVTFEGAPSLKTKYLRQMVGVKSGSCFKRSIVDKARLNLFQTYLLGSVNIEVKKPDAGKVDLHFKLVERHQRSVRVGTAYQSDEGLALLLGWEHRNLLGSAERLQIDSRLSKSVQNVLFDFRLPKLYKDQQVTNYYAEWEREDATAFLTEELILGASISQFLSKRLRGSLGIEWRLSEVEASEDAVEEPDKEQYSLIAFPLSLTYDKRDQALDPTKGFATSILVEPTWDTEQRSTSFVKTVFASSFYTTWEKSKIRPTLALRAAIGNIEGENLATVPETSRFFVGGGGSVRGYAFQSLGPSNEDGAIGGLSFAEFGVELRLRWGDNYGAAFFVDAGSAFDQRYPEFGEDLRMAAGFGFRYFTSIAPLRVDLAFPLDRRPDVDDSFQFYISLGQAF